MQARAIASCTVSSCGGTTDCNLLCFDREGCGLFTSYAWSVLGWRHCSCKHTDVVVTPLRLGLISSLQHGLTRCRLRFYAAPGVPLFVRAIAVIAWVTSLSIVALVPVDVLDSLQGTSGSITGPLGILWSVSYW